MINYELIVIKYLLYCINKVIGMEKKRKAYEVSTQCDGCLATIVNFYSGLYRYSDVCITFLNIYNGGE